MIQCCENRHFTYRSLINIVLNFIVNNSHTHTYSSSYLEDRKYLYLDDKVTNKHSKLGPSKEGLLQCR